MKIPSSIEANNWTGPRVGVDWGGIGKGCAISDGRVFKSVREFVNTLTEPTLIVTENSTFAHDLARTEREETVKAAWAAGHIIAYISPKQTGFYRQEKKSDIEDARAILRASIGDGKNGKIQHLQVMTPEPRRSNVSRANKYDISAWYEKFGGKAMVKKLFPKPKTLTPEQRTAFCCGSSYSESFMRDFAFAVIHTKSREQFHQFFGAAQHGFPCYARSVHQRRNRKVGGGMRMPWSTFRRALRNMRAQVMANLLVLYISAKAVAGTLDPENLNSGTQHPAAA